MKQTHIAQFLEPFELHVNAIKQPCYVGVANTFMTRARGLLWRPPLRNTEALWISHCSSIHTVGMAYPIDVVFLDSLGIVCRVCEAVKPMRFRWCRNASSVLEFSAGQAVKFKIQPGCQIASG